ERASAKFRMQGVGEITDALAEAGSESQQQLVLKGDDTTGAPCGSQSDARLSKKSVDTTHAGEACRGEEDDVRICARESFGSERLVSLITCHGVGAAGQCDHRVRGGFASGNRERPLTTGVDEQHLRRRA